MYESSLRALDTKSQIFIAFLTITVVPVFGRLADFGVHPAIRAAEAGLFGLTTLMFVICLYPRRGHRSTQVFFDISRPGSEVGAIAGKEGMTIDYADTIAALHDIFTIKQRFVRAGTLLLGGYVLTAMAALALR